MNSASYNISPASDELVSIKYDSIKPVAPIGFEGLQSDEPPPAEPDDVEQETKQPYRKSQYFDDGIRKIDYVLVYEDGKEGSHEENKKQQKRKRFEESLRNHDLQLEYAKKDVSFDGKTNFVKIHAPWHVLCQYAEILKMKMPLAENDMVESESCWSKCPNPFELDPEVVKPDPNYFTAPFNRERMEQYHIKNKETFFTDAQRSRIVYEILSRAEFEDLGSDRKKFGIKRLQGNAYIAAFPLHAGPYKSDHSIYASGALNDRHLLYEMWARPKMWCKYQPLDIVRRYFGEKIGIYFFWLAYYTNMLIPAAIVGVAAFFYGIFTMMSDVPSNEICNSNKAGNLIMCPLCDEFCNYWHLKSSCSYSRASYLFDNAATVFFAGFMSLWSVFFIEFWKRHQKEIEYDWDVSNFEDEEETIRPEFEATVTRKRINPINKAEEPYVPFWSKMIRYSTAAVVILFMLCLVIGAVIGVIVYRIVIIAVFAKQEIISQRAPLLTTATASVINLIAILILNLIYKKLACALTNLEQHRTQTEWEDGFTLKMFLFQFVNYYSSIFYIAFLKGRLSGSPNDYKYLNNERLEECHPSGCLIELCIQLGVVMVGKQAFNNFVELLWPKILNWIQSRTIRDAEKHDHSHIPKQWERDYVMTELQPLGLFYEYLEMVLQFGFVTIFVAAFPLAPLFALINNIIEIRLDAYKFVTQLRRPLAARAQDIGVWYGILKSICIIAVISNAFIIAVTSDFIPKLVYKMEKTTNHDLTGYINFSLSVFDVKDFPNRSRPLFDKNITECRYRDYRYPPSSPNKYQYTIMFWHILAARMAFVIVFENFIVMLSWFIAYLIPDIPYAVKIQILRENYLVKEALFKAEANKRAKAKAEETKQD